MGKGDRESGGMTEKLYVIVMGVGCYSSRSTTPFLALKDPEKAMELMKKLNVIHAIREATIISKRGTQGQQLTQEQARQEYIKLLGEELGTEVYSEDYSDPVDWELSEVFYDPTT